MSLDYLGFACAVLLIELTPGPNMAWLAGLAATDGRRCGFAAAWGVALGLFVNAVLAAVGLTALLNVVPQLWSALRIAGSVMMGWLAVQAWRSSDDVNPGSSSTVSARRAFRTGALINLLNPKAYMFFLVVAPQFLGGGQLTLDIALIFSAISVSIATTIHFGIVLAGSSIHRWIADPSRTKMVRRVFAGVILAVGISFLFADTG